MSRYSGKCDLFDAIAGMGGWYDRDGNSVKFGQEGVHAYYSDELQDFEAFKKLTNGVIHQHHKIDKVDEWNQDFVKQHCKEFDFVKHEEEIEDKRTKSGKKLRTYYTYKYWGKDYTASELNKKGVYIETDIHFNTLLDLIPYYPYLVSASCGSYYVITNESFVDREFEENLQYGWIGIDYKKELQKHYLEVSRDYFLIDLDKRTHYIDINGSLNPDVITKDLEDGTVEKYYTITTDRPIDYMHDIEFVWDDHKGHTHWTSPKMIDENTIGISYQDIEQYLTEDIKNGKVKIRYIEKCNFKRKIA